MDSEICEIRGSSLWESAGGGVNAQAVAVGFVAWAEGGVEGFGKVGGGEGFLFWTRGDDLAFGEKEGALFFALGEMMSGRVLEMGILDVFEDLVGTGAFGARGAAHPVVDHGFAAAEDGLDEGFVALNLLGDRTADEVDVFAKFFPGFVGTDTEEGYFAGSGSEVSCEGAKKGRLAGAVGSEDRPGLAFVDAPGEVAEDGAVASDGEVGDLFRS